MKNQLFIFLCFILVLQACSFRSDEESGEIFTETRAVSGVKQLSIEGIIDLRLNQGDKPELIIEGDEEAIQALSIRIDGEKLSIGYASESSFFKSISTPKVRLTLADLESLEFNGVGNFIMEKGFEVKDLDVRGSGIGNIELDFIAETIKARFDMMGSVRMKGEVISMGLRNDGVGQIDAGDLIAQNVNLISSGIGQLAIHCENELALTVNGIGSVVYSGDPTIIKREINGIGKVKKK
ncbi:GIN domain-containing protein [Algoriphagus namhaensis]